MSTRVPLRKKRLNRMQRLLKQCEFKEPKDYYWYLMASYNHVSEEKAMELYKQMPLPNQFEFLCRITGNAKAHAFFLNFHIIKKLII